MRRINKNPGSLRQVGVRLPHWLRHRLEEEAQAKGRSFNFEITLRLEASLYLDQIFKSDDRSAIKMIRTLDREIQELRPGQPLFGLRASDAEGFNKSNLGYEVKESEDGAWSVYSDDGSWRASGPNEYQTVAAAWLLYDMNELDENG